jgi:tetratricopeptide (TPR) repeat protein
MLDRRNIGTPRPPARAPHRRPPRLLASCLATWLVTALALASAFPSFAAKKNYRYEEDPIRLGRKALTEGRLDDARKFYEDAVKNEWEVDQARFGLGEILRNQAIYGEAETMYRQAILDRNTSSGGAPYPEANAGLGLVLLKQNRKDEARKEFLNALAQKGGLWEANFGLAQILFEEKKWDEALPYVEKGRGKKGVAEGEDLFCYGMARIQFGKGENDEAIKNALRALNLNPNESDYGTLVADIYVALKSPAMAIKAYEDALAAPGVVPTPRVHQVLGQLYEGEKQYTDALRHYKEAMQTDSTFAPAYKSAGRLYSLATRYQDAARFYIKYTQLKPEDAEGQLGLAEAFYKMGTGRKALEAAEKAYALDSTNAATRLLIARTAFLTNDMARSEKFYATVPDTSHYEGDDWVKLAQIAIGQKKLERADTLLAIALAKDSTLADAYSAKGKIFLNRMKADSAAYYFEKSLRMSPNSSPTKINLGIAYLQQKRFQEAAKILREAVAMSPDFVQGRVFLGQALLSSDSLSAALIEYKKAVELDPKNGAALRGAAFVHMKRGEYPQAVTLLRQATEADPRSADSWVVLGQSYAGMNNIPEAIKAVEKGLEINPAHEQGKKVLDILKKAQKPAGK